MKVYNVFFSPTDGTKKAADELVSAGAAAMKKLFAERKGNELFF